MDGLGQDPVRGEKDIEGDSIGDDSAFGRCSEDDRGAEQEGATGVLEHRPTGQSKQAEHLGVASAETWSERHARPPESDRRHGDEGQHTEGAAEAEQRDLPAAELGARISARHQPEHQQRRYDHDGVGDRRRRGKGEDPPGVEQGDGEESERIQDELRQEEAQQRRGQITALGQVGCRARPRARQQVGDRRSEDDTENRECPQADQRHAEKTTGPVLGLGHRTLVEQPGEGRHEDRGQRAGRQQLEDHRGQRVGPLEGVTQIGRAENGRHDEDPSPTEHP